MKFRAAFTGVVKLSFAKIDGLIGTNLPMKAFREPAWWSNSASSVHAKAYAVGWEVQAANLKEGYVIFKKVCDIPFEKFTQSKLEVTKPFTPVPVRSSRSKLPSKTKVSKLYARRKDLERQRAMSLGQVGGFKPRTQHEEKLFGPTIDNMISTMQVETCFSV